MQERSTEFEFKKYTNKWFLDRYFKYGSVESAISAESLPISTASYHRLIKSAGVVPSAGRHTSFPEVLHFFRTKALSGGAPLEEVYRGMPTSFQTSLMTLHRIYHLVEESIIRRNGVALIIKNVEGEILVANESEENSRYKEAGELTIPMGFAKETESAINSIFRILQHEVSTLHTLNSDFSTHSELYKQLEVASISPFMHLQIIDVDVSAYEIIVPETLLNNFSSYKLVSHRFMSPSQIQDQDNLRLGVSEVVEGHLYGAKAQVQVSLLNRTLLALE